MINWFNEEGCRFKPSMMGSSVYTGKLSAAQVLETTDPDGVTVREALESIGTIGDFELPVAAYVEIHIEQGRSLEDRDLAIGLVESTWGANKYEFVVHGDQAHTGATIIADRQDALLGASALVVAAREIALEHSTDEHMVITSCGEFNVFPNSPVVVASRVNLLVDVRSTDPDVLAAADADLHARVARIEKMANVRIERGAEHVWGAKAYDRAGLELAAEAAESLGLGHGVVRTLAGPRFDEHEGHRPDHHAVRAQRRGNQPQRARADPVMRTCSPAWTCSPRCCCAWCAANSFPPPRVVGKRMPDRIHP